MEPIEQVLLHVRTVNGYRSSEVVAATEFVRTSDLTEVVAWFSEHEDESILQFDVFHLFFHPLPSGDFALGIVHPSQSGFFSFLRPPKSFFVRLLLIPSRTLLKKGNNPIALFEELRRRRKIPIVSRAPKRLTPILPSPSLTLLDVPLLKKLSDDPGAVSLAALHQSCFDSICTFFQPSPETPSLSILNGLLNLLPLRFRTELTFSSALHFSRQIPFRLVGVGASRRLAARQAQLLGVPLLHLADFKQCVIPPETLVFDAWSRFVFHLMRNGDFSFFERQLDAEYRALTVATDESDTWNVPWENLNERGAFWLKAMNEKDFDGKGKNLAGAKEIPSGMPPEALRCSATVEHLLPLIVSENDGVPGRPVSIPESKPGPKKTSKSGAARETSGRPIPLSLPLSERIERFPELKDRFLRLDSDVARALFGDETVLGEIATLWKEIRDRIPWTERERLREEYVALIRSLLVQPPDDGQIRSVDRGVRLLDLMLLFLDPNHPASRMPD